MAKSLQKGDIVSNNTIRPWHVTQSVDAFTGIDDYDIKISGSLALTGSLQITGSTNFKGSVSGSSFTGSFTGSFNGTASYAQSSSFSPNLSNTNLLANGNRKYNTQGNSLSFITDTSETGSWLYIEKDYGGLGFNTYQILVQTGSIGICVGGNGVTDQIFTAISGGIALGTGKTIPTSTVDISGSVKVTGSLYISGSSTIGENLTVKKSSILSGSLIITGSNTISGSLIVTGSTSISGSSTTSGSAIFQTYLISDTHIVISGSLLTKITSVDSAADDLLTTKNHQILLYSSIPGGNIYFPSSPIKGLTYIIQRVQNTNSAIMDGNGKNINGASTYSFPTILYTRKEFLFDGTQWFVGI